MVARRRGALFFGALTTVLLGATQPRSAAGQSVDSSASGTNVTGVAQRFFLSPTSCEADPCVTACTDLLIASFSSTASSYVAYVDPFILPSVLQGTLPVGCVCETACSVTVPPTQTSGTQDNFDVSLLKYYTARNVLNLTLTCASGLKLKSSVVNSFAPALRQMDIEFPVGFGGSAVACTGSYAVLPLSRTNPPVDRFLGLSFLECVDPPLGVASQVQLTPSGCSADPCLAACSGRTNGLLYYNPQGQFRFFYQWILQPFVGATIPPGCSCSQYNCMHITQPIAGIPDRPASGVLISAFLSASAGLLAGDGVPFYCSARNFSGSDGKPPDFKVRATTVGQKTGIAVQFAKGCSAIYAVAAGLVFNASQTTSIPNIPIPVPAPVQDNSGLSKTAETVIIVVCVVIGGGFLCLCGALYYMYKRERRGEPLFSRLEEVEMDAQAGWATRSARVEPSP